MGGVILMFAVAALCAVLAVVWFLKPARSEASVYRHRIGATMLMGGAMVLTVFAIALLTWSRQAAMGQ